MYLYETHLTQLKAERYRTHRLNGVPLVKQTRKIKNEEEEAKTTATEEEEKC